MSVKHVTSISTAIIFGMFFFCAGNSFAIDESNALTLAQCLSLAEKQSELLKIQYEKKFQSQERVVQARGGIMPEAGFKHSKSYKDATDDSSLAQGEDSKFTINQPLFYGFRKWSAISIAANEKQKQELELFSIKRGLKADVAF